MKRNLFFASLRRRDSGVFGTSLGQGQVDGCNSLLDACDDFPISHAAHVLAEVYHETGGGMMPVKETVYPSSKDRNPSDATVIARLDRAFARGHLTWVKTPYWREGWFGRGQIQLTHEYNYRKAAAMVGIDLVNNPGMALQLRTSARIAATGCQVGLFTGKKLADFDGPRFDHYGARAIVNSDKRSNGKKIAGYAKAFEVALSDAGWALISVPVVDATFIEPPTPPAQTGWLAELINLLKGLFR